MDKDEQSDHSGSELCLALLLVMERVVRQRKRLDTAQTLPPGADASDPPPTQSSSRTNNQASDDLVNLAETIFYCINEEALFFPQGADGDVVIDRSVLFVLIFLV